MLPQSAWTTIIHLGKSSFMIISYWDQKQNWKEQEEYNFLAHVCMFSTSSTSPSSLFQLYSSSSFFVYVFDGLCKGLSLAHHRLSTIERSAIYTLGSRYVLCIFVAITRLIVWAKSFKFKTISLPTRKFFEKSYDVHLFCKVKNMVYYWKKSGGNGCSSWMGHIWPHFGKAKIGWRDFLKF